MDETTKEIVKLTTKELLKSFGNLISITDLAFSRNTRSNRIAYQELASNPIFDIYDLKQKIYELKQKGYINRFTRKKTTYLELTPKGIEKIKNIQLEDICVKSPEIWDKKWRIVIFDIPEDQKNVRNGIRSRLYQIGFNQIQKSVFVYPFECTKEINLICDIIGGREYVKFLIADIIEGEEEIIRHFVKNNTLTPKDLEVI